MSPRSPARPLDEATFEGVGFERDHLMTGCYRNPYCRNSSVHFGGAGSQPWPAGGGSLIRGKVGEHVGISASEYLLRDLKRKRLKAGLTQAQLGERIHYSDTHVSGIETGSKPVTFAYLRLVDEALGLDDHFQVMWEELVKDSDAPVWLREWMVLEREATALRWYEHAFVPGLLQTEAYMRAIFSASHRLQANDIEQQVASRLERQKF